MPDIDGISGVAASSIDSISGKSFSTIDGFSGVDRASSAGPVFDETWTFDGQATSISTAGDGWSPIGDMSDWASGSNACNGTNNRWASTQSSNDSDLGTTRTATGFRIDYNATGSGGTGPSGAHNGSGGHDTSSSTKYAYGETSGSLDTNNHFIARTPGYNYSSSMSSTQNDLDLKFYVHAYGDHMGVLKIYYDVNTSSKSTAATLLATCQGSAPSGNTGRLTNSAESNSSISPSSQDWVNSNSSWVQFTVSLNAIRAINSTHYIYFVYQGTNNFHGDLSLDDIQIVES